MKYFNQSQTENLSKKKLLLNFANIILVRLKVHTIKMNTNYKQTDLNN